MFQAGITRQFKRDVLSGVHQPEDTYKIALYLQSAAPELNRLTSTYSDAGELASGNGYERGGRALTGAKVLEFNDSAYIDFDDAVWPNASLSADAALIYNASRENRTLAVMEFPRHGSTAADFIVEMPALGLITFL